MKKSYIAPQMKAVQLMLEKALALSIGVGSDEVDVDDAFSSDSEMSDDDWDEE